MSVPLEKLYHYIENLAKTFAPEPLIIYRFVPNGSKNINDLKPLYEYHWEMEMCYPHLICHDQEPLNFAWYQQQFKPNLVNETLQKHGLYENVNLSCGGIFDQEMLLHSEQQSLDVDLYKQNNFVPVYYWCHALLARDWFRHAQHLVQIKRMDKIFLIYNRSWSGTREYRLKFVDFLIAQGLAPFCRCSVNAIEPELGVHYANHEFDNPVWMPDFKLENYFSETKAGSHSSADFEFCDYEQTQIEVVLETLFDQPKLHLTEKILRPIACGQPFLLAGPAGSLNYLKHYGFKTFDDIWDESYDQETDAQIRLNKIVTAMKTISEWDHPTRKKKLSLAYQIADFNKKRFFSEDFWQHITAELKANLATAIKQIYDQNTSQKFLNRRKRMAQVTDLKKIMTGKQTAPNLLTIREDHPWQQDFMKIPSTMRILTLARKYCNINTQNRS